MSINSVTKSIFRNRVDVTNESTSVPMANGVIEHNERSENNIKIDKTHLIENVSREEVIDAIESANKEFIIYDRRFEFSIHEKTNQIMVKVIDVNSEEIIREIPPEKILDMVASMWEIAGIIVDEKV